MRKKLLILTGLLMATATAQAEANTIFSCTTTEDIPLTVKKSGTDYTFSYGKLTFSNPIKEVIKNQRTAIAGGSGFTTITIELKHKEYSFLVGYIEPRNNPKEMIEPGFSIIEIATGRYIQNFPCDQTKKIVANFDRKIMPKSGFAKE